MDVLPTFIPAIIVILIVFSPPLFHAILAAGQAVGRLAGSALRSATAPPVVAPAV